VDVRESDILDETEIGRHWYYRAKAAALARSLPERALRHVLDVGAGSGFFSRYLLANTAISRATCIDPAYANESDDAWAGKSIVFRRRPDTAAADLILFMDVLEHVDDDLGLLKSFAEQAAPGTVFVVTVPAFRFLWSPHDEYLGHKRRYTIANLSEVLQASGLSTVRVHYFYALVFPLAVVTRVLQNMDRRNRGTPKSALRKHGSITNGLLWWLSAFELNFMRINRMFGLTVFAVLEKA
jgi:SAM-dependent methyltransferase